MSRTLLIIGLFIAAMAHWMLLLPSESVPPSNQPLESTTVAMRELIQEMLPSNPKEAPAEPVPEPVSPPAAQETVTKPAEVESPAPQPVPNLSRTAETRRSTLDGKGDFSGDRNGTRRPVLRIDWGSPDQAKSIVKAGSMRLVLLSTAGGIDGEIQPAPQGWLRVDSRSLDLSGYSNRVRIVDSTTAFAEASSLCQNGERLAVLLPLSLEHRLRTQQIRVAAEAGIESAGILAFYGRFRMEGSGVAFDINGIERRTS